ncbi:hypothetical protein [Halocola ammonii]
MNSNFTMVPELSFQDFFPNEATLTFSTTNEVCRVQVKAGNLLFVIKSDGSQIAFSVENVTQRNEYSELRFTMRKESTFENWPSASDMSLTKTGDFVYEGVITGDGLHEKIRLDIQS